MVVFPRALRLSLLLALLFAAPSTLDAQSKALAPRESATTSSVFQQPGWLYEGSDITPDPDWYFGTLPNGLRYAVRRNSVPPGRSEEHTSELQSLMRTSYAVFCLKKKNKHKTMHKRQ